MINAEVVDMPLGSTSACCGIRTSSLVRSALPQRIHPLIALDRKELRLFGQWLQMRDDVAMWEQIEQYVGKQGPTILQ